MQLIDAIKKEQAERGLSDAGLSRLLGVDASLWSRVKRGERPPGAKFLRGVMAHLPELTFDVMNYMRGEDGQD